VHRRRFQGRAKRRQQPLQYDPHAVATATMVPSRCAATTGGATAAGALTRCLIVPQSPAQQTTVRLCLTRSRHRPSRRPSPGLRLGLGLDLAVVLESSWSPPPATAKTHSNQKAGPKLLQPEQRHQSSV
jgi:hypothetical protein